MSGVFGPNVLLHVEGVTGKEIVSVLSKDSAVEPKPSRNNVTETVAQLFQRLAPIGSPLIDDFLIWVLQLVYLDRMEFVFRLLRKRFTSPIQKVPDSSQDAGFRLSRYGASVQL